MLVYDDIGALAPLSNDFICSLVIAGRQWRSVEHYYQAAKFLDEQDRDRISLCLTGAQAREIAWGPLDARVRPDWDEVRRHVMALALEAKFTQCAAARRSLISTWPLPIAEDSPTNAFWGLGSSGRGQNVLGSMLAELRSTCFGLTLNPVEIKLSQPLAHSDESRIDAVACSTFLIRPITVSMQVAGVAESALTLQSIDVMIARGLDQLGVAISWPMNASFHTPTLRELGLELATCGSFGTDIEIAAVLGRVRREAFDRKYSSYRWNGDARSVVPNWSETFLDWLSRKVPPGANEVSGIVVGAGAGEEAAHVWRLFCGRLLLVDLGPSLVENCRLQCPKADVLCASAEDLSAMPSGAFDFYCSLRTYQSLLFDYWAALREARRVLKPGGLLVISVSDAYVRDDGELQRGQIVGNSINLTAGIREICDITDAAIAIGFSSLGYFSFETELVVFAYTGETV